MKRPGRGVGLCLAVLAAASGAWYTARAQNFLAMMEAPALPAAPPNGAWGEVIMANERWIVVQNQVGQQFPIATNRINQFLVRWPTDASNLTPESVIEAAGAHLGSNVLQTDHVDVFEGADRNLVQPAYRSMLPNNRPVTTIDPTFQRMLNAWDIGAQASLYGWAYPIAPARVGMGEGLYAVGSVLQALPNSLQIAVPGNNFVSIVPGPSNFVQMTQVTLGSPSFVEKGDPVFLTPRRVTPESLEIQQLVLYKKIPRNRFGR